MLNGIDIAGPQGDPLWGMLFKRVPGVDLGFASWGIQLNYTKAGGPDKRFPEVGDIEAFAEQFGRIPRGARAEFSLHVSGSLAIGELLGGHGAAHTLACRFDRLYLDHAHLRNVSQEAIKRLLRLHAPKPVHVVAPNIEGRWPLEAARESNFRQLAIARGSDAAAMSVVPGGGYRLDDSASVEPEDLAGLVEELNALNDGAGFTLHLPAHLNWSSAGFDVQKALRYIECAWAVRDMVTWPEPDRGDQAAVNR